MNRDALPLEIAQAVGRLQNGYYGFRAWAAALELGVVSALAAGPATAADVAARTGTDKRALERLLDALVSVGLFSKETRPDASAHYGLEPGLEVYAENEAGLAHHLAGIEASWRELAPAMRDGKPRRRVEGEAGEYFTTFVGVLFATNRRAAAAAAATLAAEGALSPAGDRSEVRVLDVGAGSGVWSLMLALRSPAVRVWALDHSPVLAVTRRFFTEHGIDDRLSEIAGDHRGVDLGSDAYDVITLGHILHGEGRSGSRDLIARSARALRPGGTLVIGEFIADEARAGRENPRPLLFALHMFLLTEDGDTYTLGEMSAWLADAGFTRIRTVPVAGASPVVLATRA